MKISKKVLSYLLALVITISLFNLSSTTIEVQAESYSDCWELQEISYKNRNGKTTLSLEEEKPTIKPIGDAVDSQFNWVTSDGNYRISLTTDGNTATLNSFAYQGSYKNVDDLVLPTSFRLVFYSGIIENKDAEGNLKSYTLEKSSTLLTLMNVGTAFDSNYVNTSTNTYLDLHLPVGVTEINENAFAGNTKLRSIEFGNAIQTVNEGAFKGCNNLKTIDLANLYSHINTIPNNCFYGCNVLEVASIPATVQNIGENAFYQCNAIDNLILGDNIKTVGENAFAMCSNLRYIYITSDYQNWDNIVASNERYKLITEKVNTEPIVASNGNTSSIGSNLFSSQRINVFGKIDLKDITVKCDNETVSVKEYQDNTYGYKTKAYNFIASKKGTYTVIATDILDNTVVKVFRYEKDVNDTTAPSLNVTGQGSNNYFNSASIEINENESYLGSVIIDNTPVNLSTNQTKYSTKITSEGEHTVTVSDVFGNTTSKTFTVDSTLPTVTGVENGRIYTDAVVIEFEDNFSIKEATLNGKNILSNTRLETSGVHKLIVSDYANNKVEINFTMGLDSPTIEGIENRAYTNKSVNLKFSCIGGIKSVTDDYNGTYKSLNTEKATISGEGTHIINVEGYNGKLSTVEFTIDTIAPVVESSSGKSKYVKNLNTMLNVTDENLDKVLVNDVNINSDRVDLTEQKTYKVVAIDKAGNTTSVTYKVDTKAPTIKGVKNNKTYKKAVKLKFSDKNGIKKVTVNKKKLSAKQIKKGYKVKKKGKYTVKVWDNAGNTKTIKFKIVKK